MGLLMLAACVAAAILLQGDSLFLVAAINAGLNLLLLMGTASSPNTGIAGLHMLSTLAGIGLLVYALVT